jgi:hypothetical protein
MKPPLPPALRLTTRAEDAKPPRPPFGLRAWSPSASAVGISLDLRGDDAHSTALAAAQVPRAFELPVGTQVIVLGVAARGGSVWQWFSRSVAIPRAVRCGALLARGYVDIGAGIDEITGADLAWGIVPG